MKHNYQKCIKLLMLMICGVLSQYSGYSRTEGNNDILKTATFDTPCAGTSAAASQGTFSTGYTYNFQTVGNSVNITFTLLDTDKVGVVAYLWQQTPFAESSMAETPPAGSHIFTKTITGQTIGATITYAVKFAYAGGMSVTQYYSYVVGDNCGGTTPVDTVAPGAFTATVGAVTSTSVQLLLTGTDDSGSVIYTVTYGGNTATTTGISGAEHSLIINNLTADTDYTFTVTAADAGGNAAPNNPVVVQASTPEGVANTACAGTSSEAGEGTFSTGYTYSFQTVGTSVTATFQLLDTDKQGVVAYLWQQTPFVEMPMDPNGGLSFSKTVTGLTLGTVVNYAVKFAYAGGLSRTVYYSYTVGDNCSGTTDTEAPTAVTATVGTIASTSVQLLLNGTDDSGSLIYTITYNGSTVTTSGASATEHPFVINGLVPGTEYTITVTAADLAGNAATTAPITLTATTLPGSNSMPCSGTGNAAAQGTFSTGYSYSFQTINGTDVVVTFTLLDTDKQGVVAYLWQQTPFAESGMVASPPGSLTFTKTITGQTAGATIGLAVKFAYSGGLVASQYINYVVGQDCEDTTGPAGFTATAGDVTENTVELLLNGTDASGTVVYTITYGGQTMTVLGTSGVEESVIIEGLTADTEYSFSIVASDEAGNEAANNPIVIEATTLGGVPVDTTPPADFTGVAGVIGINTVELLLNATDDSGDLTYTITYGSETITLEGVSGVQGSIVIDGLDPETAYTFTITVADASGNEAAAPVVIQATTLEDLGVDGPEMNAYVKLYPNPATSVINIDSPVFEVSNVEIYSVLGAKVLGSKGSIINIEGLSRGMYLVKVQAGNKVVTKKLIVE